jgi:hypothetical protein
VTTGASLSGFYKIQGFVRIQSTLITEEQLLTVFGHVQQITGYLEIYNNTNLVGVEGLHSLTNVSGYLSISRNTNLVSVEGLRSLKSIRGTYAGQYTIYLDLNPALARGLPFPALTCKAFRPAWPNDNNAYVTANIPAINSLPTC